MARQRHGLDGRLQRVAPSGWITNLSNHLPRHNQILIFQSESEHSLICGD